VDSSSIPPGAFAGAATMPNPCMVPPVFLTAKVTLPALAEVVSALKPRKHRAAVALDG
jgi:hypothetical protein